MRAAATAWVVAIAAFVTYLRAANQSAQTVRLRSYWLGRLARDLGADDPFRVTMDELTGWLANESWSGETRKSARASVAGFYRWAVDSGRITERANPARRLPHVGVEQPLPRPAPDRVLMQALWFANDRDKLMLMLAAYGGLRRAEIARVHPADFDWDSGELLVHGKGRRQRRVPLHPDLAAAVRTELELRRVGKHGSGYRYTSHLHPDSYLFPGTKAPHVTPDTVGRIVEQLLAGPWTAHTLRHRFATKAYAPERDLRAVQDLLGHSKPETTARYVQTPSDAKRAAVLASSLEVLAAGGGSGPAWLDPQEAA